MDRKLSHHNNFLSSFIDIMRALPIFCNHLEAGNVSISIVSRKSWVSPLKAFARFRNLIRFHHKAFIIRKNGQSLKILTEVFRQKVVSNVILAVLDHRSESSNLLRWSTMVANREHPPFQNLWSALECLYLAYLNFLLCFLFFVQTLSIFLLQFGKRICHFNT